MIDEMSKDVGEIEKKLKEYYNDFKQSKSAKVLLLIIIILILLLFRKTRR